MKANKITGLAAAAAMALLAGTALAKDDFPSKAIHVIVPYPAGGIVDIVARSVTDQIGRDWNQSVIVEAKPGAESNIGTSYAKRSAPDGYTWLVTGPAVLVNPAIYKDPGWSPLKDFKCVGIAVWNQSVAIVPKTFAANSMKEFVAYAKAHPGELNFGNPGVGSSIDLSAKKLFQTAGIKVTNVGYKGQPPALVDLIGNRVQFEIVSMALALPHIKDGTVKPLAVMTHERVKALPDVPTIAEAGFGDAAYVPWYGIYVPAATPEPIVEKIHAAIDKSLEDPAVQERLSRADIPGKPTPLKDLAALMKSDYESLTAVVKASGEPQR